MSFINNIKAKILRAIYKGAYRNGHYYSPVPDINEVRLNEARIFNNHEVADIRLSTDNQIEFLKSFLPVYKTYPFSKNRQEPYRYYYDNSFFNITDSLSLYFILNRYKPENIIEVGSGFSSALMLDTCEYRLQYKPKFTFIDPYADRLKSLLKPGDQTNCEIIETPVQRVNIEIFRQLKDGDLLFIDSSHVSKVGSDLNFLLFQVLPILSRGVIIHFHDICYPFEYPKEWILDGIYWNEAYLLRAFLMNNDAYEILLFNHFITQECRQWLMEHMPSFTSGGSLYIRKK